MPTNAFTQPELARDQLYASPTRLQQRTGALHAAKIAGEDAATTIVELAARHTPPAPTVCDIGCGRGTTTLHLGQRLAPSHLIALDRSPALLGVTRSRIRRSGATVQPICSDFHRLPIPDSSITVAVAAFCLYHSECPGTVLAELARVLTPDGHAILATKSADSYHELDDLIADTGLDASARAHPSLYSTFHSENAADIAATRLTVEHIIHQHHRFRFDEPEHLAHYLTTTPKYNLDNQLIDNPIALAERLRSQLHGKSLTTSSTVTYLVTTRP